MVICVMVRSHGYGPLWGMEAYTSLLSDTCLRGGDVWIVAAAPDAVQKDRRERVARARHRLCGNAERLR